MVIVPRVTLEVTAIITDPSKDDRKVQLKERYHCPIAKSDEIQLLYTMFYINVMIPANAV